VNQRCIDFVIALTKNIDAINIFVGEFSELQQRVSPGNIFFKEQPTNSHYQGK
jgi:deoxyribodipyrimidine photo-lyase